MHTLYLEEEFQKKQPHILDATFNLADLATGQYKILISYKIIFHITSIIPIRNPFLNYVALLISPLSLSPESAILGTSSTSNW